MYVSQILKKAVIATVAMLSTSLSAQAAQVFLTANGSGPGTTTTVAAGATVTITEWATLSAADFTASGAGSPFPFFTGMSGKLTWDSSVFTFVSGSAAIDSTLNSLSTWTPTFNGATAGALGYIANPTPPGIAESAILGIESTHGSIANAFKLFSFTLTAVGASGTSSNFIVNPSGTVTALSLANANSQSFTYASQGSHLLSPRPTVAFNAAIDTTVAIEAAAVAVPEPSSVVMMVGIIAGSLVGFRRRLFA